MNFQVEVFNTDSGEEWGRGCRVAVGGGHGGGLRRSGAERLSVLGWQQHRNWPSWQGRAGRQHSSPLQGVLIERSVTCRTLPSDTF